jgi:hypothetical protein
MSTASVNGLTATQVRLQVPAWGIWWADVDLASEAELSGRVTLSLADAELSGTIVSGGSHNGRSGWRITGGAGGWNQRIPEKAYRNDAGVNPSSVLSDAASEAGETLSGSPSAVLARHFVRPAGRASWALNHLAPQGWYMALDGTTVIGVRAGAAYTGDASLLRMDVKAGRAELATMSISELLPGVTLNGRPPVTDSQFDLDGQRLTATLYFAGSGLTRRLRAFASILDALDPMRVYRGVFEYRVATQDGNLFALQPVRVGTGLPMLDGVSARPGLPGARFDVTLGELVLVAFIDSDPSRPCIVGHDDPDAPGWSPTLLELGDTGGELVALSDKVDASFSAIHDVFSTGWTPVPNDGGAALKVAWAAAFTGPPPGFASVAAEKVKAK